MPENNSAPKLNPQDQIEQSESDQRDIALSTIGSCLLLSASIYMLSLYYACFGFNMWGESPEHWKWAGGLVGLLAILIRFAVIGFCALPLTICSVMGMTLSIRLAMKSSGILMVFSWLLVVCHIITVLPLAILLFVISQ